VIHAPKGNLAGCAQRNDDGLGSLSGMSHVEIAAPLFRAMKIYTRVAGHDLDHGMRRALARHIQGLADQGVRDPGRLTVHGLTYLRQLDRQPTRHGGIGDGTRKP
jgi:hypothetical protein